MDNYYNDKYNLDDYFKTSKENSIKRNRPKRFQKKEKKSPQISLAIVWIVIGVLLVGTVGAVMYINRDTTFTFSKGVSISGIDISKMTYKQARQTVLSKAKSTVNKFRIKVSANGNKKIYTHKDFDYSFAVDKALKEARIYSLKEQNKYKPTSATKFVKLENPIFPLTYKVKNESVNDKVLEFSKLIDRDYENARVKEFHPFAEERFTYQQEKEGYELVKEDLTDKLKKFIDSKKSDGEIYPLINVYKPKITVEDLKENIVGLSKATSISYNTENGNTNMRVALESCNGSVIEPGELWSFNSCTGNSNLEENGYKSATVISGKKLAQGIGGGLCQASTTIFRAAIFANMSIYQRHNHFWASSYAYPGEDATIDYPNLDLKLRNTTDYQMFMECKMEGTTLTVNIYGYQDPSYDNIKIYSKNYDIKKKHSYKTNTYRVLYLDGKIVKEEQLCSSVYSLKDSAKVKSADSGTFRTKVDGTVQYETEPPTKPEKKKKPKKSTKATETTESTTKNTTETTAETTSETTVETTVETEVTQETEE